MGAGTRGTFRVTVAKKEVIAAALPLQQHWLPLSNLDLLLPPLQVTVFFCYHKPTNGDDQTDSKTSFGSMVSVLKVALAQTLVSYYAFGGEIVPNSVGEPELLCNNRGVDFYEAFADIELKDLNFYNPDESIEGKFVPELKDGVFAVQATELKYGGLVVACKFDHRVSDAFSANMFLVSWAETAQSKPISIVPSFRRSLLNPRRPGIIDSSLDDMYVPLSSLPPPPKDPQPVPRDQLISRIYYIKATELDQLQSLASSNGSKRSKLESFSAFLWQLVAKSVHKSGKLNTETSKLGIVVDGRSRLNDVKSRLMDLYFGNVLSIPYGGMTVHELMDKPLSLVANEVHGFLEESATKEHFLNLIDWVEANRPISAVAKIYASTSEDGPAMVVSSGQRFPVYMVDFGWGSPIFGSYHFPWGGTTGYVMPMPSPAGNGDWIVYMHLFQKHLEFIEAEANKVFRPLSFEYLTSI